MKRLILLLMIICMASFATANMVISEVGVNPAYNGDLSETGKEYIELYNPTDSPISIGDWSIQSPPRPGQVLITIPSGTTIAAHGYYLIANTGGNGWPATWQAPDLFDSFALDNTDEGLLLLNSSDGKVDAVGWGNLFIYIDY